MDDLTLLRSLRDDVAEPDAARLAPAYLKLETAIRSAEKKAASRAPRGRHPIRWAAVGLTAAAAVAAAVVVGGVFAPPHPESASAAAIVLRKAASEAITYSDPVVGPGQYLKFHIRADWGGTTLVGSPSGEGIVTPLPQNIQNFDLYIPADRAGEWATYRDWAHGPTGDGEFESQIQHYPDGKYEARDLYAELTDLDKIPTGSGTETFRYFDAQYQGGSANRDEDNFVRITDILRFYPVPATLRARMFEALALIPGTTSTDGVANLDGQVGVAIGRTEAAREGQRQEIIIDPATGQVIGDRIMTPENPNGGPNGLTAISTTVVDSAP